MTLVPTAPTPPATYTPLSYYPYGTVANAGPDSPVTPLKFGGTRGYYTDTSGLVYIGGNYINLSLSRYIGVTASSDHGRNWNTYTYNSNLSFTGCGFSTPNSPKSTPIVTPPANSAAASCTTSANWRG